MPLIKLLFLSSIVSASSTHIRPHPYRQVSIKLIKEYMKNSQYLFPLKSTGVQILPSLHSNMDHANTHFSLSSWPNLSKIRIRPRPNK